MNRRSTRPSRSSPRDVGNPPLAPGAAPPHDGRGLPLPHEHDEGTGATNPEPEPKMRRAKQDLDEGQVDTDLRATPGLDAARRDRLLKRGR